MAPSSATFAAVTEAQAPAASVVDFSAATVTPVAARSRSKRKTVPPAFDISRGRSTAVARWLAATPSVYLRRLGTPSPHGASSGPRLAASAMAAAQTVNTRGAAGLTVRYAGALGVLPVLSDTVTLKAAPLSASAAAGVV